jgi:peroxiredoxin
MPLSQLELIPGEDFLHYFHLNLNLKAIICVSVNDGSVMAAWKEVVDPNGAITFIADPHSRLIKALGFGYNSPSLGCGPVLYRFDVTTLFLSFSQPTGP